MKGLLHKELYLGKKNYLIMLGIILVVSLLGFLVCLSIKCGNLKDLLVVESQRESNVEILVYLMVCIGMYFGTHIMNSIYDDYSFGWQKFTYTLPTQAKKIVGAKYILLGAAFVFALIVATINWSIYAYLADVDMQLSILKNASVLMLIGAVIYSFLFALSFWYKNARAVSTRFIIVGVVAYIIICAYVFMTDALDNVYKLAEDYVKIRNAIFPFIPVLMIGIVLASYVISVKIYDRRDC